MTDEGGRTTTHRTKYIAYEWNPETKTYRPIGTVDEAGRPFNQGEGVLELSGTGNYIMSSWKVPTFKEGSPRVAVKEIVIDNTKNWAAEPLTSEMQDAFNMVHANSHQMMADNGPGMTVQFGDTPVRISANQVKVALNDNYGRSTLDRTGYLVYEFNPETKAWTPVGTVYETETGIRFNINEGLLTQDVDGTYWLGSSSNNRNWRVPKSEAPKSVNAPKKPKLQSPD